MRDNLAATPLDEHGMTVEVRPTPPNLFGTDNPKEVISRATDHAKELAEVIKQRELYKVIGKKAHVFVEAWCLLGSMVGVFPVEDGEAEPVEIDGVKGFKATCKAVTLNGDVVGRATAYCMRDEDLWNARPQHALAAMAQTRATSRALRGPLGFIVQLAGYSPTGAEEMPADVEGTATRTPAKATQAQHAKLNAMCADLDKAENPALKRADGLTWEDYSKRQALDNFGCESRADLSKDQMSALIQLVKDESEPFG